MVANYELTVTTVIKPFADTFDYRPSNLLSADENLHQSKMYPTQELLDHAYLLCG